MIERRLIEILKAYGPTALANKWIVGNIYSEPNDSSLPLGYVSVRNVVINEEDTQTPRLTQMIRIGVIVRWADDLNAVDETAGYKELTELCDDLNDDLELKDRTVLKAILDNRRLFENKNAFISLNPSPDISFDKSPGAGDRPEGIHSVEGVVDFTIQIK